MVEGGRGGASQVGKDTRRQSEALSKSKLIRSCVTEPDGLLILGGSSAFDCAKHIGPR
jgi:hypothetical protein